MPHPSLDLVKSALGISRIRTGGRGRSYRGDCVDLLPLLPAESIALTVTSPPYNIGKEYEVAKSLDDYLAWCARWLSELPRATAADGAFWLNLGYVEQPGAAQLFRRRICCGALCRSI